MLNQLVYYQPINLSVCLSRSSLHPERYSVGAVSRSWGSMAALTTPEERQGAGHYKGSIGFRHMGTWAGQRLQAGTISGTGKINMLHVAIRSWIIDNSTQSRHVNIRSPEWGHLTPGPNLIDSISLIHRCFSERWDEHELFKVNCTCLEHIGHMSYECNIGCIRIHLDQ